MAVGDCYITCFFIDLWSWCISFRYLYFRHTIYNFFSTFILWQICKGMWPLFISVQLHCISIFIGTSLKLYCHAVRSDSVLIAVIFPVLCHRYTCLFWFILNCKFFNYIFSCIFYSNFPIAYCNSIFCIRFCILIWSWCFLKCIFMPWRNTLKAYCTVFIWCGCHNPISLVICCKLESSSRKCLTKWTCFLEW